MRHDRSHQVAAGEANFDAALASTVLVEAIFLGDVAAAEKYGVDARTVKRWRARSAYDPVLVGCVQEKEAIAREHWADQLVPGIQAHIAAGMQVAQRGIVTPEMFAESNRALQILLEAQFSLEILNARNAQSARILTPAGREVIAGQLTDRSSGG